MLFYLPNIASFPSLLLSVIPFGCLISLENLLGRPLLSPLPTPFLSTCSRGCEGHGVPLGSGSRRWRARAASLDWSPPLPCRASPRSPHGSSLPPPLSPARRARQFSTLREAGEAGPPSVLVSSPPRLRAPRRVFRLAFWARRVESVGCERKCAASRLEDYLCV